MLIERWQFMIGLWKGVGFQFKDIFHDVPCRHFALAWVFCPAVSSGSVWCFILRSLVALENGELTWPERLVPEPSWQVTFMILVIFGGRCFISYIFVTYQLSVGTGGSPKNWSAWWCKCNKTLLWLFTVFSAHTQIAFMLMLREHMPCLFATRGRFLMTFLDTFSSQHIETA